MLSPPSVKPASASSPDPAEEDACCEVDASGASEEPKSSKSIRLGAAAAALLLDEEDLEDPILPPVFETTVLVKFLSKL